MVRMAIGSAVQVLIRRMSLRCFSLLPAVVYSAAVPSSEARRASIGLQERGVADLASPTSSASPAVKLAWISLAVRWVTLSVASRNNHSLRSIYLEFPIDISVEEPHGSPTEISEVGVSRPSFRALGISCYRLWSDKLSDHSRKYYR